MILGTILLLAATLSPPSHQEPAPAAQPAWEQQIKQRREALISRNGPGTDAALRDQLLAMGERDQVARGIHPPADGGPRKIAPNLAEIDRELTAQLKDIFFHHGWPTIGLVGIDASNAAMLLLTHTPDHEWQHSLLPQLETLADSGRIDASSLALVIDKDLVAHGQLQRYGSQFKSVDGQMAMYAVEDPANLDRRRADVLLAPMDVYRQLLMNLYHLKISSQIVPETPPAK